MHGPEFLEANTEYVARFEPFDRSGFKNLIVVTCMDPRVNPYDQLGLKVGDAITIRNAGGSDALRSIMVAQHFIGVAGGDSKSQCMSRVTTEKMREIVKEANPGQTDVAAAVDGMDFIHIDDIEGSVKEDVEFLAENALVVNGTKISGWVYDVETGKISQVAEAVAQ
ncbi:carbonic anhydrase [Mycena rosella]|uniref:Carbonic anhydrase n=1 Tax=Mycena rosella TaxID=1033263 RepID=A0AAD7GLM4_MYCRO|nr:carbonic anhydrase [Mycena rosella]